MRCVFLCPLLLVLWASSTRAESSAFIRDILTDIRPGGEENPEFSLFGTPKNVSGDPVIVTTSMYILEISEVDDDNQDYKVTMYLRLGWNDARYAFTPSDESVEHVQIRDPSRIWVPDIFFVNEKKGYMHDVTTSNTFVRIKKNGDVLYSARYTVKLSCPMDHAHFPYDKQRCEIRMESYGFTMNEMVILWKEKDAFTINKKVNAKPFNLEGYGYGYCNAKLLTTEYSCIRVEFLLARTGVGRYLLQAYVPLGLLLVLNFALLWCPGCRGKRIAVSALLLLTTVLVAALVVGLGPSTGDSTALECWAAWSVGLSALPTIVLLLAATMECCRKSAQAKRGEYVSCAEDPNKTMELLTPKCAENGAEGGEGTADAPAGTAAQKKTCVFARLGLTVPKFEQWARLVVLALLLLYVFVHALYYALSDPCYQTLSTEMKFPYPAVDQ